jgi:ribosomal protein S14
MDLYSMSDSETYRQRAAALHPNKTGYTEQQGFCSCGTFCIADFGICRRCKRELDELDAKDAQDTQVEEKKESVKQPEDKLPTRPDNIDKQEYDSKLKEAGEMLSEMVDLTEKLKDKQAKRIDSAKKTVSKRK